MFKKIPLILIRIYQKTLSLDHGFLGKITSKRACIFYPSCSQYSYEAIEKFGLIKGFILSIKRVARCNPYSKGGIDEVPK